MSREYKRIESCLTQIRKKTDFVPKMAIVLGSGLGAFADGIKAVATISYNEIEGFPVSTVQGHKGRFVFGYVENVPVVIMQGRVHFYEGYTMEDCVLPIRLMRLMGAESLLLTNASGGIGKNLNAGDFMIIDDHISLFVKNPLIGENIEELGTRFPDMSRIYDEQYSAHIESAAENAGIDVKRGVYAQLTGPSYESPAEIRMLRNMGVDAVGMSTVCEAIAAKHAGFRVCGISCVSNMAAGICEHPLSHEEVQAAMDKAGTAFGNLLTETVKAIY